MYMMYFSLSLYIYIEREREREREYVSAGGAGQGGTGQRGAGQGGAGAGSRERRAASRGRAIPSAPWELIAGLQRSWRDGHTSDLEGALVCVSRACSVWCSRVRERLRPRAARGASPCGLTRSGRAARACGGEGGPRALGNSGGCAGDDVIDFDEFMSMLGQAGCTLAFRPPLLYLGHHVVWQCPCCAYFVTRVTVHAST